MQNILKIKLKKMKNKTNPHRFGLNKYKIVDFKGKVIDKFRNKTTAKIFFIKMKKYKKDIELKKIG